jgi:S1-C subfamily serine protease
VGDRVFVVGAPLGISHTLTVGYLSARRAPDALMTGLSNAELFQTDAAINQGNSGGPMFNMKGEVVGIVSHMISVSGGFEGLGFAVTSNAARELLIDRKGFWGGLSAYHLQGDMADILNVPQAEGLLVQVVAKGSPSERLGLRGGTKPGRIGDVDLVLGGDIILEVQGVPVARKAFPSIREQLSELQPGQLIKVKVLRDGEVLLLQKAHEAQ